MDKLRLLEELAEEIRVCPKCRLAQTRTHAVPGEGTVSARIMFVGEGPGEQEDLSGRPFVGRSGQLLTRELENIGIVRADVFITNIVKCRPPQNRVPMTDEIEACQDWLMAQIALIEPKFIVPVGGPSLQTLVSKDLRIMKSRGRVFRKDGILFIPVLHPSAALRSPTTMGQFKEDLANLKEYLGRDIREDEITDIGPRQLPQQARVPIELRADLEPEPATGAAEPGGNLSLF